MTKIVESSDAIVLSKNLHDQGRYIVLVGGCFDIIHLGHITFLEAAKKQGDILFVLLESDASVRKYKGETRPIHPQIVRAKILQALSAVDYVIILPPLSGNHEYDDLVLKLKPDIIATTKGDLQKEHKLRQAEGLGIQLVEVVDYIPNQSSTKLAEIIAKEFTL